MEESTDEEDSNTGCYLTIAHSNQWDVEVTNGPPMNGHIPRSPEGIDIVRIPPIAIEITIGELENLTHQVQERMEGNVEHQ